MGCGLAVEFCRKRKDHYKAGRGTVVWNIFDWANGKKIEENQLYNVASSSFLTDGGDGYLVFKKGLETKDTGINIYEVVKGYLANKEMFNAQIEGRIIEEI